MKTKINKYLVAIAGPTAVGKTQVAIDLAKQFQTAILSADSRQFYREMEVGTAKPTQQQQRLVKHHFIDHLSILDPYDAGQFERDALAQLTDLFEHQDVVFLVGGSGLYLRAVLNGFDAFPEIPASVREEWTGKFQEHGIEFLAASLAKLDPEYFRRVDRANPARLIRALGVITYTGRKFSAFLQQESQPRPFIGIRICLELPREELYTRINQRVDQMIDAGLVDEVKSLVQYKDLAPLQTVGYRELFQHFAGELSLEQAIEKIKQHTRNYAKRQITWFRNQGSWEYFSPTELTSILGYIRQQIQNLESP